MRNRIAAAAAAGILTIGMAVLPSAASASEVAPSTDGLAGSTAISGQIDQDMAVCTDKTCDAVQHVRKTNQQIKSDIDTAKQHAEQLHQNAHEDADALRQYGEQAWKNYQEDREDIKNAIDGAVKRDGQRQQPILHHARGCAAFGRAVRRVRQGHQRDGGCGRDLRAYAGDGSQRDGRQGESAGD